MVTEKARAWKELKQMLARIQDPDLRSAILGELTKRAIAEWGYNPENGFVDDNAPVELTDWEKVFVADIRKTVLYDLDVRAEKRKKGDREFMASMMAYVRDGGKLEDIPAHIRCESVDRAYRECRDRLHAEMMEEADFVIKRLDAGM